MQLTVFDGVNFTSTEEFTIEVSPSPNEQPTISTDTFQILLGGSCSFEPSISDPDGDALTILILSPPQFGNVQINENLVIYRADSINK